MGIIKQSEATLTNKCRSLFKETRRKHPDFFYRKISDRFQNGIPDMYIAFNKKSAWIELKATGKKPSKIQEHTLTSIEKAGVQTLCTDDFNEVVNLVEFMLL